jgi:proteasome lid subunit RPN8/RPN11
VTDYSPVATRLSFLAEGDPRNEVCGFVVEGASGKLEVVPVRNVAREGGQAFEADPAAHLALARRLRREGGRIAAVFHSHLDGPARLSAADLAGAVVENGPALPGADQIVIGLDAGKVREVRVFRWTDSGFSPVADL